MVANVEPPLKRLLESDSGDVIEVVLRFAVPSLATVAPPSLPLVERRAKAAEIVSERVHEVLERTALAVGEEPAQVSVFPAIGSACVQAHPSYFRALLRQEEVVGAVLNESKAEPPQ